MNKDNPKFKNNIFLKIEFGLPLLHLIAPIEPPYANQNYSTHSFLKSTKLDYIFYNNLYTYKYYHLPISRLKGLIYIYITIE